MDCILWEGWLSALDLFSIFAATQHHDSIIVGNAESQQIVVLFFHAFMFWATCFLALAM
jgi:hypothetical protein